MSEKKKKDKQELSKVKEQSAQALTLEQVMAHPVVQQLNQKLEETRQLLQGLPEAIGRAVAEAQRSKKLPLVGGPPVQLMGGNEGVEFHRKGRIVQNGKEVAPEGPTQGDFVKMLSALPQGTVPALPAPFAKPETETETEPPVDPAAQK